MRTPTQGIRIHSFLIEKHFTSEKLSDESIVEENKPDVLELSVSEYQKNIFNDSTFWHFCIIKNPTLGIKYFFFNGIDFQKYKFIHWKLGE